MKTNHTSVALEWDAIVAKYSHSHKSKWSGEECVLAFMHFTPQNWFMAWEFVRGEVSLPILGRVFLSHRAPARITDLSIKYPSLIEKRDIGQFTAYRIRYENMDKAIETLPQDLWLFMRKILTTN